MTSLGLIDEMESDVSSPTIGDNSLKEMSELCAEQVQLESELAELEEAIAHAIPIAEGSPISNK